MYVFSLLKEEVKALFPAYFALVMSTGIVSIAAHLLDFPTISVVLFWINNVLYAFMLCMLLCRVLFFFSAFNEDLRSHAKGAGFLTLVAATCILGIQHILLKDNYATARGLWYFALVLWIMLTYTFFIDITTKREKPSLEQGINGIWLVIVVATQSVAILGTFLAHHLPFPTERVVFLCLCGYMLGCMLYIILITLIFYRLTFFPMKAEGFAPPYWINMGAVAISTLSGATLILSINETTGFLDFIPFLKGFSLFFWVTGTWWIPLIVILGLWRHIYNHFPLFYHPQYWGMVFPLGMYTVCTWRLAQALKLPYLQLIPSYFIYIAFAAWAVTFLGLCLNLLKLFTSKNTTTSKA
ncbi:tellurite resistance protein TehA-like permease [Pontibacter ummariensis]|uniref:Tellurite resistance protein TehA n=1 Tax=Pontibacter ummariensis TaxID=1610492 RepID=A0A239LSY1_9BACT|nr:tellurite resistance/C4-dicarboxylate transporter family protein [Pontibacter ummariensis]PRY01213.1 tellurite resistance protein TehA-like permease [Pontibacter ummariensis]SNT33551.1 Tellurite resistance protein TehA [Pontibacter ummariensis]